MELLKKWKMELHKKNVHILRCSYLSHVEVYTTCIIDLKIGKRGELLRILL